jgi:hypothetical protein
MIKLYLSAAMNSSLVEVSNFFVCLAVARSMIYPYTLHHTHAITQGNAVYSLGDRGFKLNQGGLQQ